MRYNAERSRSLYARKKPMPSQVKILAHAQVEHLLKGDIIRFINDGE